MTQKMFSLIYEFDGQIPDSRWYQRLREFTEMPKSVRGTNDYSVAPSERRGEGSALIIQEGIIMCASRATRDYLHAFLVNEVGPAMLKTTDRFGRPGRRPEVTVGEFLIDETGLTDHSIEVAQRVEKKMSVRGRPPAPKEQTVHCDECLTSTLVFASRVSHCPNCSSVLVRTQSGKVSTQYIADYEKWTVEQLWLTTRVSDNPYATISYRVFTGNEQKAHNGYRPIAITAPPENPYLLIAHSMLKPVFKMLDGLGDNLAALRIVDSIVSVIAFQGGLGLDVQAIEQSRTECVIKTYMLSLQKGVHLKVQPDHTSKTPDFFTAAHLLDHDELAEIYVKLNH